MKPEWDCIVVGGGSAGLSAALVLGRARKRTLLVDAGNQCNLSAEGIGGLLGHDGLPPQELYAKGRKELEAYPSVEVRDTEAVGARKLDHGFEIRLADDDEQSAERLLLASGLSYGYPDIPGARERWGRSVFHCPFCHGWEARDQDLGVIDGSPKGPGRARLLRCWSDEVTLYTNGEPNFEAGDAERLDEAGISVDKRKITELRGKGEGLAAIAFEDGAEKGCQGVLVAPTLTLKSQLVDDLGLETVEELEMVENAIKVDSSFSTSVEGVFAAGDATGGMPSVANSIAEGSSAASHIVHSFV